MRRMPTGKWTFIGSLVVALAAALFLHFWRIGSAPPGFFADECSIAYNAYCIAETGADEYGVRWPVFFRSFDTYTDPVNVYSVALPIRVFGLREWAARLPSALYCLAACVAFYMLLRAWQLGKWFALAGGLVLSAIPWVFPLSRNCAFAGQTAALLGLVMGLMLTDSALRRRSNWRAVLAGVAWAFAFSAHQSIRPVVALLALGCGAVLWRPLVRRWRVVLLITISALVVLLPMIISVLRSPAALLARFHQVGVSREAASFRKVIVGVAGRYLDYFSPRFLFIAGDHELRHHTGWGGELYWCLAPLILAGLYVAIRYWRRQPRYRIVLVGLLVSPVSAALTVDRMHSTRCAYGVVFWLLLAMLGAHWLWQQKRVGRKLLAVLCVAGLIEGSAYLADYFGPYQMRCRVTYGTAFAEAVEYCFSRIGSNQTLYVSGSVSAPSGHFLDENLKPYLYAYFLFYGRIDPRSYQHGGLSYTIFRPYFGHIDQPGVFLRCNYMPRLGKGTQVLAVANVEPVSDRAKLLATFQHHAPIEYQVFEIK